MSDQHSSSAPRDPDPDASESILAQHLDPQFTASLQDESLAPPETADGDAEDNPEPQSSLLLQGGDIHRDLYRIEAKSKLAKLDKRSASFSFPPREPEDAIEEGVAALEPGSFRRHFVQQHNNGSLDYPGVTTSFLDFLDLYGNFAGEDLAETEEDESLISQDRESRTLPWEQTPLIRRARRGSRVVRQGDASNMKTFFTLLKAFVGTGIIFLPKAFRNGGILFSSITLVTVAMITTVCFHLLLQCRRKYGGGYGEIGERISGSHLRSLILSSITISQMGFVCTCFIFTAENIQAFLRAMATEMSTGSLILLQLLVLIPLAWIRNISKLGPAALLSDVFILLGLGYIYWYDITTLVTRPGADPTVQLFNPHSFTLTIGSSIFTFEGIGLVLPIQSSMKQPQHFDRLLYMVMSIITVLFTAVGALSYATFGNRTQTEIFSNFPQTDRLVNTIQFLYSLAVLVGAPIQLFPATRIMEGRLFGHKSGKGDTMIKWKKNMFRMFLVLLCGFISSVGAGDLDKFVSVIGSFACVPLVYIYPAYLHWKGVAESSWEKRGDIAMMVLGFIFMVYTTIASLAVWVQGSP
ncbi:transmembrane amino acid transporter protein-domain-containing protein [Aspergillus bertholletiae]|uniref:Transmembrane amino acid transporter protein-domain-containing protein n=1 Tax=Aspergillus bertholletiae TaxID=1226010 RepID=A0A5N7BIU9_9EURO|nr:transmembrane amino acid transporter protein-domain-containing protein [Aspergillus bertholletiae]